jgi:DNA polymerase
VVCEQGVCVTTSPDANQDKAQDRGPASLSRLVLQHARTASLLGVDFVPSFRTGASGVEIDEPAPASVATRARAASQVEAKPTARDARASDHADGAGEDLDDGVTPSASALFADDPPKAAPLAGWQRPDPRDGEDAREHKRRCLDALRARYEQDAPHQHFVTAHTRIVFGDGDPAARLVFVGEAPGEEEDRTGVPFVGRAGQLLNKMIVAMGLSREEVYICNVLKTRPPNNATPTSREAALCEPYLVEQLSIVSPRVIVTLGLPASRTLLKSEETMTRMRGRWATYRLADGSSVPVMPTYHPAFLLRSYTPENRKKVWDDLQLAMDRLGLARRTGASGMA